MNKYKLFLFASLSPFLICSCSSEMEETIKENSSAIEKVRVSISDIDFEDDIPTTRSDIYHDGTRFRLKWTSGDVIGVYPDVGSQVDFPIKEEDITAGGNSAEFDGGGWALKVGNTYSAYYPYSYENSDINAIPLNFNRQTQIGNNNFTEFTKFNVFASEHSILAEDEVLDFTVKFQGVAFWFKFTMPEGGTYTKLRLNSDGLEFTKTALLDIAGETPSITPVETSPTITMKLKDVTVSAGEVVDLYMWILPGNFASTSSNLTAEIVRDDGATWRTNMSTRDWVSGNSMRFIRPNSSNTLDFVGYASPTINFVDSTVEAICLENWDTNGDDELDMEEAAAVTTLDNVFSGTEIESFNELQYFTGLDEIEDNAFADCHNLASVLLPITSTRIGDNAFRGTALSAFVIPSHVEIIGNYAFADCKNLLSDDPNGGESRPAQIFNDGIKEIGDYAFSGCSALYVIALPSSLTSLGEGVFSGCTGLLSASIDGSITEIKDGTFSDCYWLSVANIPETLVRIGNRAFWSCIRLNSISLPEGFKEIGDYAFYDSGLNCIELPESLEIMGEDPFGRCTSMQWAVWKKGFETSNDIFSSYLHYPIYVRSDEIEWLKSFYPAYEERFAVMETQDGGTVISNPDMQGGW